MFIKERWQLRNPYCVIHDVFARFMSSGCPLKLSEKPCVSSIFIEPISRIRLAE